MRLFVALLLPGDVRSRLAEDARSLSPYGGMKPVAEENIHITLAFLGEVEAERAERVKDALGKVPFSPFPVEISGAGAFPSAKSPRVIWAGAAEGAEKIRALYGNVSDSLSPLGFAPESRFHPHATLARVSYVKDDTGLARWIAERGTKQYGSFISAYFSLMESVLRPQGPLYGEVERYPR